MQNRVYLVTAWRVHGWQAHLRECQICVMVLLDAWEFGSVRCYMSHVVVGSSAKTSHKMENFQLPAPISLSLSHPLLYLPPAHANLNHHPPATAVHWFLLLSDFDRHGTTRARTHTYANSRDHIAFLTLHLSLSSTPTALVPLYVVSRVHLSNAPLCLSSSLPPLAVWAEGTLRVRTPAPSVHSSCSVTQAISHEPAAIFPPAVTSERRNLVTTVGGIAAGWQDTDSWEWVEVHTLRNVFTKSSVGGCGL